MAFIEGSVMQACDLAWSTSYITALIAVAVADILHRRISNPLCLTVLAMGVAFWTTHAGLHGLGMAAGGAAVGGFSLLAMYVMGWVGAADVKVAFGLGALLGPSGAGMAILSGFLVCGLMSLGYLSPRLRWRGALTWARIEGRTVPMGAALAIGVLLVATGWIS